MNQHRQNLAAVFVATTILTSTDRTLDHWVNNFQVGWVKGQRQVDWTAAGGQVAGEAVVVFHVAVGQAFSVTAFPTESCSSRNSTRSSSRSARAISGFTRSTNPGNVQKLVSEVADAVLWLCENSFVTGTSLAVDGGWSAQ